MQLGRGLADVGLAPPVEAGGDALEARMTSDEDRGPRVESTLADAVSDDPAVGPLAPGGPVGGVSSDTDLHGSGNGGSDAEPVAAGVVDSAPESTISPNGTEPNPSATTDDGMDTDNWIAVVGIVVSILTSAGFGSTVVWYRAKIRKQRVASPDAVELVGNSTYHSQAPSEERTQYLPPTQAAAQNAKAKVSEAPSEQTDSAYRGHLGALINSAMSSQVNSDSADSARSSVCHVPVTAQGAGTEDLAQDLKSEDPAHGSRVNNTTPSQMNSDSAGSARSSVYHVPGTARGAGTEDRAQGLNPQRPIQGTCLNDTDVQEANAEGVVPKTGVKGLA